MKHFSLLLIIVLGFSILGKAGVLEFTYTFQNPVVKTAGDYQILSFENTTVMGKTGEPGLPYQEIVLLLPPGEELEKFEITRFGKTEISGFFKLYPVQQVRPVSFGESGKFECRKEIYNQNASYPTKYYAKPETNFFRGHGIVTGAITPVEYVPASGSLHYYNKIKVKIYTKQANNKAQVLKMVKTDADTRTVLKQTVHNYNIASQYSAIQNKNEKYDILVVTSQSLKPAFASLMQEYVRRGYAAKLFTTDEIGQLASGADVQDKIRNFIINQYVNSNVKYVVLGGDNELVPARGFYCQVQSSSLMEDSNIPADLYYSALDGNWNTDGDDKWAEPEEDDLLPDISVGRIPASDATDLASMIHKTLSYQNTPVENELDKVLLVGEKLWDNPVTWGAQYLDLLIGRHTDNGYTTTGIPVSDPVEKLYDRDLPSEWTASTLRQKMNSGKSFVHHVGHSNYNYVMRMYNSDITNQNFAGLNGTTHNYTLIYTHGCICGAFDENDCIAEEMLKIENLAVAFVGNSRYGWFNEGQTEGPSPHLHREFINALYTMKENHIGAAHMISKIKSAPWIEADGQWEPGAIRWVFYDCNVLGDPSLQIWTKAPLSINTSYPEVIHLGDTVIDISISGEGLSFTSCYAAFTEGEEQIGSAYADTLGNIHLVLNKPVSQLGIASLTIGGYNIYASNFEINVIPPSGPYVVLNNFITIDNNNMEADCGETIKLKPILKNLGLDLASGVYAVLSSADLNMEIENDSISIGTIEVGSNLEAADWFTVSLASQIPDQYALDLVLEIFDGNSRMWVSKTVLLVNAPKIAMDRAMLNDLDGNGNQIMDQGESFKLIVPVSNSGHKNAGAFTVSVTSSSSDISFEIINETKDTLDAGCTHFVEFEAQLLSSVNVGAYIPVQFQLVFGEETFNMEQIFMVGIVGENFENASFNVYPWVFEGDAPWTIASESYEGTHAAKSGVIDNYGKSRMVLSIDVTEAGNISFFSKVSSENNYDYLRFYVDETEKEEWCGEVDWASHAYPLTVGPHTLVWEYSKDVSLANGSDCAWVDNIVFPPSQLTAGGGLMLSVQNISKYMSANQMDSLSVDLINLSQNAAALSFSFNPAPEGWLTLSEADQSIPALEELEAKLYFNTNGLNPGEYKTNLLVVSNDTLVVPVLLKVIEYSGLEKPHRNSIGLVAFPNPFVNQINIELGGNIDVISASIFDIQGREIRRFSGIETGKPVLIWDGNSQNGQKVAAGIYFCVVKTKYESRAIKISKSK